MVVRVFTSKVAPELRAAFVFHEGCHVDLERGYLDASPPS